MKVEKTHRHIILNETERKILGTFEETEETSFSLTIISEYYYKTYKNIPDLTAITIEKFIKENISSINEYEIDEIPLKEAQKLIINSPKNEKEEDSFENFLENYIEVEETTTTTTTTIEDSTEIITEIEEEEEIKPRKKNSLKR